MSTRVKFLALFGLLFSLMTFMLNYSSATSEISRGSEAQWSGVLGVVLAFLMLVFAIEVVLSWKDPFAVFKSGPGKPFIYYVVWALAGIGTLVIGRYIKEISRIRIPVNNTTTLNGSAAPPAPIYYNNTTTLTPARESLSSQYVLYLVLIAGITVFVYTTVLIYRDALKKRERKEMKLRAELFDKKLDELGLDMFSDPREAVVGIYKNAVLWLEVLGIPYRESWTHWEHAERVRYMHDAFVELTRLFEKAKYAPEKVTWDDAKRALDVYRKMRGGLREAQ
ncbi:DUF4129 domain-containing protein [Thermococcus sp. LS1]|uniref:DUF4129 domain-containing protein n=1 Tax=Thermococcus sp. LS1 TaxID=1638259 RepID=UPI00143A2C0F|nr:DUF4129 domain-containing protein [Thermococcus sp. LS1]NJD98723.1 DUF4129 domain-containing protein [Thermococcus sp. LS1]